MAELDSFGVKESLDARFLPHILSFRLERALPDKDTTVNIALNRLRKVDITRQDKLKGVTIQREVLHMK